jgi:hypothetical protein
LFYKLYEKEILPMPKDTGKRKSGKGDTFEQSGTQEDHRMTVDQHRTRAAWVNQLREGSNAQSGTHTWFDNDGNMVSERPGAQSGTHIRFDDDGNEMVTGQDSKRPDTQSRTHIKFDDGGNVAVTREVNPVSKNESEVYSRLNKVYKHSKYLNWNSDWKTSTTKKEISAVLERIKNEVRHEEFYVAHHTFSKFILEEIDSKLMDSQRAILGNKLDIHLNERNQALSNLYSNLSIGPRRRIDDPKSGLDATFYQVGNDPKLIMDPRSQQYQIIDGFMRPRRDTKEFSDQEFTENILKPLEKAEKIHVVLTKGYNINPEVSMWKKVNNNKWGKVPIQISEYEWKQMCSGIKTHVRDDKPLSELKKDFHSSE